jgi:hypothetical protein
MEEEWRREARRREVFPVPPVRRMVIVDAFDFRVVKVMFKDELVGEEERDLILGGLALLLYKTWYLCTLRHLHGGMCPC